MSNDWTKNSVGCLSWGFRTVPDHADYNEGAIWQITDGAEKEKTRQDDRKVPKKK